MAELVSTTITPTYSDPLRAQSIKALEQRHKEMLAQSAQAGAITPENTQTPVQGFGHLANQLGDSFQRSRVDQAAAAQRQALAQTIAGMDPNNPKPQELATINSADPELAKQMIMQLAEHRRALMQQETTQRGQNMTLQASQEGNKSSELNNQRTVDATLSGQANEAAQTTARLDAQKAAAAEKVRTDEIAQGQANTFTAAQAAQKRLDDEAAAAAQENRLQSRPTDLDVVKADRALARGEIDQATRDAIVGKATGPSASEMKAGNELQNTHLDTQGALSDMKEARDLLGPKGAGIRAGAGGGYTQTGAKWIGDAAGLSDPELTRKTERYNQIMSAEAITAMAQKLKGASTDYEMKAFVALMNDPNADPENKVKALNAMIAKAEAHLALQQDQLKRAKVSVPGGAAAAPVDPVAEAQDAINRGAPFDAVAARFKGDKSLLKPKGP
jgi:hypothetical protein